jgi:uncharacterized OsmC-like protein
MVARVENSRGNHQVSLSTNGVSRAIEIAPRATGFGSSASGGELLLLALATCYCNDIYREAAKLGIQVERVEVEASGEFAAEGAPASNVRYRAKVVADAPEDQIHELMRHTDSVAEIQNTLRTAITVKLDQIEAESVRT